MAGSLEPIRQGLNSALDKALRLNQGVVDAYLAPGATQPSRRLAR